MFIEKIKGQKGHVKFLVQTTGPTFYFLETVNFWFFFKCGGKKFFTFLQQKRLKFFLFIMNYSGQSTLPLPLFFYANIIENLSFEASFIRKFWKNYKRYIFTLQVLLFDIIIILSKTFFILTDEFVDACSILRQVLLIKSTTSRFVAHTRSSSLESYPSVHSGFCVDLLHTVPQNTFSHEFHYPKHFLALKTE